MVTKSQDHPHPQPPPFNSVPLDLEDVLEFFELPRINRFHIQFLENKNVMFSSPNAVIDTEFPKGIEDEHLPPPPAEVKRGYYLAIENDVVVKVGQSSPYYFYFCYLFFSK